MNWVKILEYVLDYAPLAFLLIAALWGFIVGLIRGFRKSLILFIQALIAAAICVTIFYILVNNNKIDQIIYDISSKWVNYNDLTGTTTQYGGMKEVLVDIILKNQSNMGTTFKIVLEENGAYIDTLANLAYRLILFVVLLLVFFVLVFIFYIIYLIFYPERRKKAKLVAKERAGEGSGYNKHVFFGGLVGAIRGAVVGLVWLSFIGALFFIVAGGTGEDKAETYPDYSFNDEQLNDAYQAYKIVGSYGSRGLFRVLNSIKDKENVPYYLFAANMILSGNLNDEERGIHTTVRFTKEIANYTSFVNSTIKLIIKYDTTGAIKDSMDSKDQAKLMDLMNSLMENEEFQKEYDALIESFDPGTYFINFGLSFVNSVVAHRNELKFTDNLDPQIIELMNIIFDGDHKITVSSLLTEADARQLMKSVITVLSVQTTIKEDTPVARKSLLYARAFIPEVLKLSIFNEQSRKDQFEPLIQDLYDFLATQTIKESNPDDLALARAEFNSEKVLNETNAKNSISWMDELKALLNTSLDLIDIADSMIDNIGTDNPINLIFSIFPDDKPDVKAKNLEHYDKIIDGLSKSKLLDSLLSMTIVRKSIDNALVSISDQIKLPSKINYANTYDDAGNIKTYGEINVLLRALKELIISPDSKAIVNSLVNKEFNADILKSVSGLFLNISSDGEKTLLDISLDSTVLNYTISGLLFGFSESEDIGFNIIVPSNLCDMDEEDIKIIKKEEINNLFSSIVGTLDIFGENNSINFKKVVDNVTSLSNSQIIEASVIYILNTMLEDNTLVSIPDIYKENATKEILMDDFSVNPWHTTGEISNIIYALDEIFNISLVDTFDLVASLHEMGARFGKLNEVSNKNAEKTKLDIVYKSSIIRSTIKHTLDANISDEFVDKNVLSSSMVVENIDDVPSIKKSEVKAVIDSFNELVIVDFNNIDLANIKDKILDLNTQAITDTTKTKIDVLYLSTIIRYILVKQLDKALTESFIESEFRDSIYIKDSETIDENDYIYYKKEEIASLISSIKELGLTSIDNVNTDSVKAEIFNLNKASSIDSTKSKLDILYQSMIIEYIVSKQLDNAMPSGFAPEAVIDSELVKNYYLVNTNNYACYKEEEISAIIQALTEVGITAIESIDTETIKNEVINLNSESTSDSTKTKLDILYQSVIITYAITTQLDNTINTDIVSLEVRDSSLTKNVNVINSDEYKYYKEEEVSALINSLKELTITNIDNINVENIKANSLSLNEEATTDSTKTKLDVLYISYIIKYALSIRFDEIFTGASLNVHKDVLNDSKDNDEITTVYYYKEIKVKLLLDAIGPEGLNVSNLDDTSNINENSILSLNEKASGATETRLTIMYKSDIIAYILSDKLKAAIDSNALLVDDIDAKHSFSTNVELYNKSELEALIDALNNLNVTDVNAVDSSSIVLDSTVKEDILESIILFDSVSKMVFENDSLTKPSSSRITNSDSSVYKLVETEMTYLLDVLIELGVTDISDSTINITLSSDINETISNSLILRATVSKKIIENDDIKVATVNIDSAITKDINNNDIKLIASEEILNLLNAISEGLGLTDVSHIDDTLSLPGRADPKLDTKVNYISSSQIIRTTITSKLEFKDTSDNIIELYVLAEDTDKLTDSKNSLLSLLSLKANEMTNLIKGLIAGFGEDDKTATGGTISLESLQGMNPDQLNKFTASNTILLITDKVLSAPAVMFAYTTYCSSNSITPVTDVEHKPVYNTTTQAYVASHQYLALNTQLDMIAKIPH